MNKKITQKITLGGIIIENNTVLIIQRSENEKILPNMWELPSGKKEPLELYNDALLREIKEETALDAKIIVPVSVFNYFLEKNNEIVDVTQINFLLKPVGGNSNIKLSREHQAFSWITKSEVEKYNLTDNVKDAIKKAFDCLRVSSSIIK